MDDDGGQVRRRRHPGCTTAVLFFEVLLAVVDVSDECTDVLAADFAFDDAEACGASKEFFESESFVVVDDFVVREFHEEMVEFDAFVVCAG